MYICVCVYVYLCVNMYMCVDFFVYVMYVRMVQRVPTIDIRMTIKQLDFYTDSSVTAR